MERINALLVISLATTVMFLVACGDAEGNGVASSGNAPDASRVPPTFVPIAVTPPPTETPIPTATPVPTIDPATVDRGAPVFPASVDPALVDVRPSDEEIFETWTSFLTNTEINHPASEQSLHFCNNGVVLNDDGLHDAYQHWGVGRSAGISSYDWGTVNVEAEALVGRFSGRTRTILTLLRRDEQVFVTNNRTTGEATITRSQPCLDLLG